VPADAFDDHRNPDPYPLNWCRAEERAPSVSVPDAYWPLPSLNVNFSSLDWGVESAQVTGYNPDDYLDRAYYLELWIEKSTMDDILVPLCGDLGVRLVPSIGFQSMTNAIKLLQRTQEIGKPARVFYISDYDKAGLGMPISVARQIEFWFDTYAPRADIKLTPIALTAEQVARHELPFSNDKVELDALEALVPGELEKVVRRAAQPYLDGAIAIKLAAAEQQAKQIARTEWSQLTAPYGRQLTVLKRQVKRVTARYEKAAKQLNARLQRELSPFRKPLAKLQADVHESALSFAPQLPQRPAQTEGEQDELKWLFDSSREYLEQLRFYKLQRGLNLSKRKGK